MLLLVLLLVLPLFLLLLHEQKSSFALFELPHRFAVPRGLLLLLLQQQTRKLPLLLLLKRRRAPRSSLGLLLSLPLLPR
jgi:hypothetical protein